MSRKSEFCLLVSIIVIMAFRPFALELPYEVLDTIMELTDLDSDFADLTDRVNVSDDLGPTRPIYRLDLDPNYIAYYEIDMGSNYVVLSSGSKTGDHRKAESGPDPRPTDVLIQQAQDHGQRCETFYRLSPMGLTVCANENGTAVAATYNWTADTAQIENWRKLDQMVKQSLDEFKSLWQARSVQTRSNLDWATTSVSPEVGKKKDESAGEEALAPNSIVKIALGEQFKYVDLHIMNIGDSSFRAGSKSEWQQRLCKVLADVCMQDRGTKVNPSAIKETPNHLFYLKLEVHGNRTFVGNTLQWKEIGFVVEIRGHKAEVVRKHFAMDLHFKRSRRSSWTPTGGGYRGSGGNPGYVRPVVIPHEHEVPDYNQHSCCGCLSGCGAVAWAQIFAYFDRLGSYRYTGSLYSGNIYRDRRTELPDEMTAEVKRFVEEIRSEIQTFCDNGEGSTWNDRLHLIESWFKARQGSRATVVSYLERRKKRGLKLQGDKSWMQSKAAYYIDVGYPVVIGFYTDKKKRGGHFAVATKYKEWSKRVRVCRSWMTEWWTGRKRRESCSWRTDYKYEFWLRYGWGGQGNKWLDVNPSVFGTHVAYIAKA